MRNFTWVLALAILISIGYFTIYYGSSETITITIKEKERIVEKSGESISSKYLVFTNDEVLQNTDELFLGKFNSSDIQNQLDIGKTYSVKVIGWRVPFLSMYRNIYKIHNEV